MIRIIKEQNAAVIKAIKEGKAPSDAYMEVYGNFLWDARFQKETQEREDLQNKMYNDPAVLDWNHFGADARLAYETGHISVNQAAYLDQDQKAYAMNSFAEHFLQDSSSDMCGACVGRCIRVFRLMRMRKLRYLTVLLIGLILISVGLKRQCMMETTQSCISLRKPSLSLPLAFWPV